MKRSLIALSLFLLVITSAAVAQQRRGPAPGQPAFGASQTFTGTVVSFSVTAGTMHPSLVVGDGATQKSFVLGPYWFLSESKFAAKAGDRVTIVSLSCADCNNGNPVVSVTNETNGTKVVLRDGSGLPLWQNGNATQPGRGPGKSARGRGGMGSAAGNCDGVLPDMNRRSSFEGTVVSFTGGSRAGQPELTLATAAGNKVVLASPYRVVMSSGYEFTTGAKLAVTAAPVLVDGEEHWVLITLKDLASGLDLTFRDATGAPLGGRGFGAHRP